MEMELITRKLLDYIEEIKRTIKQKNLSKKLRQEVEIGANGTQKYVIKEGVNKGKTL